MSKDDIISARPDLELVKQIRADFTAKNCVEALMKAASDMAESVGVTVAWEVVKVEDKDVDRLKLTQALSQLATAGGSVLMGGKVNPIVALKAQDPMKMIKEFKRQQGGN